MICRRSLVGGGCGKEAALPVPVLVFASSRVFLRSVQAGDPAEANEAQYGYLNGTMIIPHGFEGVKIELEPPKAVAKSALGLSLRTAEGGEAISA
jgi:hypothetical protein